MRNDIGQAFFDKKDILVHRKHSEITFE